MPCFDRHLAIHTLSCESWDTDDTAEPVTPTLHRRYLSLVTKQHCLAEVGQAVSRFSEKLSKDAKALFQFPAEAVRGFGETGRYPKRVS